MIIQVYDDDLLNGEGIREVVYLQGCPHHCKGCFNPETWEFKPETPETEARTKQFIDHIIEKLKDPYITGITITGGDPFGNHENAVQTMKLAGLAKRFNKDVWIYTGSTYEELMNDIKSGHRIIKHVLDNTDVLCDGRFVEKLKSPNKPWVGSENQRVIDVQKTLKANKVILYG